MSQKKIKDISIKENKRLHSKQAKHYQKMQRTGAYDHLYRKTLEEKPDLPDLIIPDKVD